MTRRTAKTETVTFEEKEPPPRQRRRRKRFVITPEQEAREREMIQKLVSEGRFTREPTRYAAGAVPAYSWTGEMF